MRKKRKTKSEENEEKKFLKSKKKKKKKKVKERKKGGKVFKYRDPANITVMDTYYQYEGNMVQCVYPADSA